MWFYSLVFFLLVATLSAGYFFKYQKEVYWSWIVLLILMAAFRPPQCCLDYNFYVDYYNHISSIPLTFLEPTYFLFVKISKLVFGGPIGIFIIYAVLGVGLKAFAFIKLSKYYSVTLIVYFGSFFMLHEMTQIRVGVASAILLLSIPSITEKKPWQFLVYLIIGCLFHYSFIIFAVFYFLNADRINVWFYLALIAFAIVAVIIGLNLSSLFSLFRMGFISDKINTYKMLLEQGVHAKIMLINPLLYLRIAMLGGLLYCWEEIQERNHYAVVLIKLYAFSIFFFIALSDLPVMAGRVSQLLGVVEIVVVPFVIYVLRPKYYAVAAALLFAAMIMYKQLYYTELLNTYF